MSSHQMTEELNLIDGESGQQHLEVDQSPNEPENWHINIQHLMSMPRSALISGISECLSALNKEQRQKLSFSKSLIAMQSTKNIDWSKINMRHVALLIMYDGMEHLGLAMSSSTTTSTDPRNCTFTYTVEDCLWEAIKASNLVPEDVSPTSLRFDRAGRTDKGVSGCGQVVSLFLRSSIRDANDVDVNDLSFLRSGEKIPLLSDINEPCRQPREKFCVDDENIYQTEIDYVGAINSKLPKSIRVLAWSPVDHKFSARHSAIGRCYRYIFGKNSEIGHLKSSINLGAINSFLSRLIGTHDFRNICQPNCDAVNNFERTLFYAKSKWIDEGSTLVLDVAGSAFLYHQIRCIASLCLHVGLGLETGEDVLQLLDVNKWPAKPMYQIAPGEQLIFMGVKYNENTVRFGLSDKAYENNLDFLEQIRNQNLIVDTLYSADVDIDATKLSGVESLDSENNKDVVLCDKEDNKNEKFEALKKKMSIEKEEGEKTYFSCSGCVSKVLDYNNAFIYNQKEQKKTCFIDKIKEASKEVAELNNSYKNINSKKFIPVEFTAPGIVRATLQRRKLKLRLNKNGSVTYNGYRKLLDRKYDQKTAQNIAALLKRQQENIEKRKEKTSNNSFDE